MKKIKSNQHYFKISKQNKEMILDDFYIFDNRHSEISKYIKNTKEIKNILITIKTLISKREKIEIINKYYKELSDILGKFSNCSEFACFINACDSFLDNVKRDIELLKRITERYFQKRIVNEVVPEEWIQAILDTNASRKKGSCGENKLINILENNFNFVKVDNFKDFLNSKKCVMKFSKSVKDVRTNLNIKLATKKQGKKLDIIIKFFDKIFLCEAKHINTAGGAQDKQISELIEILSLKENNKNIYYISFMDGSYSNIILDDNLRGDKITTQRNEISFYLEKNSNSFWLNTAGFNSLFKDLV